MTTDVNAASWSIDNFVGGPVKQHTDAIMHLQSSLFAYSAWELHGRNSVFSQVAISKNAWYIIPIGIFFKSTAKFSHGIYSVGIRP